MSKTLTLDILRNNYDIIVFDMDGVITSEQNYWDIAALTVYEYLESELYFGSQKLCANKVYDDLKEIRKNILCSDCMISLCKNAGVNSNWDLAYISLALWLEFKDAHKCLDFVENAVGLNELYESVAQIISSKTNRPLEQCRREKAFWHELVSCYQEWYMGYDEFIKRYNKEPVLGGKPFIGQNEKTFLNEDKLIYMLKELSENGVKLGIATGRTLFEIETPLKAWGIYDYFDKSRIVTYDDVQAGEALMKSAGRDVSLVKPSPFCFLKSALGREYDDVKIIDGEFEINGRVLGVGDAGADIFASQRAGFDFWAVLTGINGTGAKEFFEKNNSTYITNALTDVVQGEI